MSTEEQRRRLQFVTTLAAAALMVWLLWSAYHLWKIGATWDPLRTAGLVIAAIGVTMLLVARIQLGNAVSFGAEANKLITTGLYSKIRNPVYVAGVVAIVGIALYTHIWMLLAVAAAVAIMQIIRARNEAKVLEAAFGDEYRAYKAKTWF